MFEEDTIEYIIFFLNGSYPTHTCIQYKQEKLNVKLNVFDGQNSND